MENITTTASHAREISDKINKVQDKTNDILRKINEQSFLGFYEIEIDGWLENSVKNKIKNLGFQIQQNPVFVSFTNNGGYKLTTIISW